MQRANPTLMWVVLAAFLFLNALTLQVIAWSIAAACVAWHLLIFNGGPGIPRPLGKLLLNPFYLFLLGMPGFYHAAHEDFWKDCWYFSGPLVYIAFGYFITQRIPSIKVLVYITSIVGTLVSLKSLWDIYENRSLLLAAASAEDYRHVIGVGAGQSMIPVILIMIARRVKIDLGVLDRYPMLRYLIYTTGTLAIVFALSRTLLIVLIVGAVLAMSRTVFIRTLVVVGVVSVCALLVPQVVKLSSTAASTSFLEKLGNVGQEINVKPHETMSEINDNWRGFEGYKALQTYSSFSSMEHLFGGGFGTLVNIGFSMDLGGPVGMQELPVLHNGYLYLLVKTGALGILLFVLFIGQIWMKGRLYTRSNNNEDRFCGYLFFWSAITFVMTQGVITGIYNKGVLAPNLMLVGAAMALCTRNALSHNKVDVSSIPSAVSVGSKVPLFPGQRGVREAAL